MRANGSTGLYYASLPQIRGAQDPGALLLFTPKTRKVTSPTRHHVTMY